jgi:hypothetical protein
MLHPSSLLLVGAVAFGLLLSSLALLKIIFLSLHLFAFHFHSITTDGWRRESEKSKIKVRGCERRMVLEGHGHK